MAELLGLGCSHGPIILTPPEVWAKGRERIFARVPGYEAPAQLLAELGDDNGLSRDISDQKKIVDSFKVMRDRLHEWEPDVVMVIGGRPGGELPPGQPAALLPVHRRRGRRLSLPAWSRPHQPVGR